MNTQTGKHGRLYGTAYTKELTQAASEGLTIQEAADVLGKSYTAINRRSIEMAAERGLSPQERAERLPPLEAVDYLLGVVEALQEALGVPSSEPQYDMQHQEWRLFRILRKHPGRLFNTQAIMCALYHDRHPDEWPTDHNVKVYISKIRKKLPADVGRIETVFKSGWRFVPAQAC